MAGETVTATGTASAPATRHSLRRHQISALQLLALVTPTRLRLS